MPSPQLDQPADDDEIYSAREDEVVRGRPVMQGDVFVEIPLAGFDEPVDVALLAHPCTMRGAGGELKPRILAARVSSHEYVPPHRWPEGHFRFFPLPALRTDNGADRHFAVAFEDISVVSPDDLGVTKRIACLSARGIYLLQQRFVSSLTRVVVPLNDLRQACEHVLEEADLQEEWVEALAPTHEIEREVAAFTELMDSGLRDALRDPTRRSQVRKAVAREIAARKEADG